MYLRIANITTRDGKLYTLEIGQGFYGNGAKVLQISYSTEERTVQVMLSDWSYVDYYDILSIHYWKRLPTPEELRHDERKITWSDSSNMQEES
jgi:hypothetical protein